MKRVVGVVIIAVLACALFLVPNVHAEGKIHIDTNVIPSEGEYDKTFTYVINITAIRGYDIVDVYLTIGPDWRNPSINKTPCKWEKVGIGDAITTLSCNTSFRDLVYGKYGDWVLNGTDPSWDWAWYKVHARSRICFPPLEPCEEGEDEGPGEPILTKRILNFYNSNVEYNETGCPDKLLFDYNVKVWQNANNTIDLQVFNYSTYRFESKGTRNCTTLFANHTLKWPCINLNRNNLATDLKGQYSFVVVGGREYSSTYPGPKITEKFYEPDVKPREGTNSDVFDYSITINANICDKIEFQVYNYTSGEWDLKGTRINYTTPGKNQTLEWHNIRLNPHQFDQYNDSRYRFVGISKSSEYEGPFWPIGLKWRNHDVTPKRGLYNYKFNYSVEVNSTKEIAVKLRVYYPHEGEAIISDNIKRYTNRSNWEPIYWNNTQPFVKEDEGTAAYKFEFYYKGAKINETEIYYGPDIGIADFKNSSAEPGIGTRETEFTYSIEVKAVKSDYLTLKVYDSEWNFISEKIHENKTTTDWKLFKFENIMFTKVPPASLGVAHYVFLTGKETKISFNGPEIIEEKFGKLFVDPKEGTNYTLFNFSIELNTSKPRNVTLWAKCDDGEWMEVESKPIVSEWETIKFSVKTPCDTFKEVCWKCKGIVSESEINCTKWDIGLNWINTSFSPTEGWWNDTFNFSVNLSANVPGDVELKVKCKDWKSVRNKSYDNAPNPQMLKWENVRICNSSYEGNTSYSFTFYWGNTRYPSSFYSGPKLFIPINISISSNVVPNESIYYIENDIMQKYFKNENIPFFNYCSNVSAAKDTSIKLIIVDPLGEVIKYEEKKYYAPGVKPLKWATEASNFKRLNVGMWNYNFSYYDARYGWGDYREKFKGPELIAVLRDFDIEPEPPLLYGESCNVKASVNGSRDFNITLELCNLTSSCKSVQNGTKIYKSSGGEKKLVWEDIKPWETFRSDDKLLFNLDVTRRREDV